MNDRSSHSEETWWPSRYGAGDQLGSLNEITPMKVVAAARLVREGVVYDLGRTLHQDVPRFEGRYWQQTLVSSAHIINPRKPLPDGRRTTNDERRMTNDPRSMAEQVRGGADAPGISGWGRNRINWITELAIGTYQIGTHLDGLNHLQIGDRFYNGWRAEEPVEEWGTSKLGIESVPPILTRSILVDLAHMRGVPRLSAGYVISVEDVEAAVAAQGVSVERGDALLFHTGWGALWDSDPDRYTRGEPGIGMAVAEWLVERRIAITGADTWSYGAVPGEDPERPFVVPQTLNVKHGLFIMENLDTAALAAARVYEFMFVLTHAKTRGSTAAGIAPAAIC